MFCIKCGTELPDNSVFCPACGTKVVNSSQVQDESGHNNTPTTLSLPPLKFQVCQQTIQLDGSFKEFTSHRKVFFRAYYKFARQQTNELYKNVNPSNLPDQIANHGVTVIGWILDKCVEFLLSNGVYHASRDMLYQNCPSDSLCFSDFYKGLEEKYIAIVASEEELAAYKKATKAYRGSWQGGGFGLKGALKGAATAGALNVADRALNRLGGAISSSMEQNRINKQKSQVFDSRNWCEDCKSVLDEDAETIFEVSYQIVCHETGNIMPPIDRARCDRYILNTEKIKDPSQRFHVVLKSIEAYPYRLDSYVMLIEMAERGCLESSIYYVADTFFPLKDTMELLDIARDQWMHMVDEIPTTTYPKLEKKIATLQEWINFINENATKLDCFKRFQKKHKTNDSSRLNEAIRLRHTANDGTYFESLDELDLYETDKTIYDKLISEVSSVSSLEEKKNILQEPINSLSSDTPCLKTQMLQKKIK